MTRTCSSCGGRHAHPAACPKDLHGRKDVFKSGCAYCRLEIPSGAPRVGDDHGNLFCCWDHALKAHARVDPTISAALEAVRQ